MSTPDREPGRGPWIHVPPAWRVRGSGATGEGAFWNRRRFLKTLVAGAAVGAVDWRGLAATAQGAPEQPAYLTNYDPATPGEYPAPRNEAFALDRAVTDERVAARFNNFWEFTADKERVHELVSAFETHPWEIELDGLCERPGKLGLEDLLAKFPLEERLYRFRCVEAWAMAVPWTGFPLAKLIEYAGPQDDARFVRFDSFHEPDQAPGQNDRNYPWPYYEGLRMDEALHPLALLVTGVYGHPLPKQHGAPIRLVVPWKYGFKSAKSIVKISFERIQPPTFWNDKYPREYKFFANVDPTRPHPRWSQAKEKMIGTGEVRETLPFNGYGEQVAGLYR